jgi:anti-sigma factor RsiW
MTDATQPSHPDGVDESERERLHAYHDGELSGFSRWRFEHRLRRSPALQRELAEIARVGEWVRAGHTEAESPDLWDRIALHLPADDARRREAQTRRSPFGWWLAWPGAIAATAGLALALSLGGFEEDAPATSGVVHWLDSGGRDVMVLEGSSDTTIIWVIESAGAAARRGAQLESF